MTVSPSVPSFLRSPEQYLLNDEAIAASVAENPNVADMAMTFEKYSRILTFDFSYAKAKVCCDPLPRPFKGS